MNILYKVIFVLVGMSALAGCNLDEQRRPSSDDVQRAQQERILAEGTSQIGMPNIKNFRERKLLKEIIEMRDQTGLITYTYLENMVPTPIHGKTALGGKLTFLCVSIGYPIPYATQFTNPQKDKVWYTGNAGVAGVTLPQADPNGLFSPGSANGTWVMCKDPNTNGDATRPMHVEPNVIGSPFKFPED